MNHIVMNKKEGDQIQFSPEKRPQKGENGFITSQPHPTGSWILLDIRQSNHQFY